MLDCVGVEMPGDVVKIGCIVLMGIICPVAQFSSLKDIRNNFIIIDFRGKHPTNEIRNRLYYFKDYCILKSLFEALQDIHCTDIDIPIA